MVWGSFPHTRSVRPDFADFGGWDPPERVEATHNAAMYAVTSTSISFWEVNPSTGSRTSSDACVINSPPGRSDVYASSSDTLYAYLDDNDKFYEIDIDACTMSELFTTEPRAGGPAQGHGQVLWRCRHRTPADVSPGTRATSDSEGHWSAPSGPDDGDHRIRSRSPPPG